MKIYINPFSRIIMEVKEKDAAFLHSIGMAYEDLWDTEELMTILEKLAVATRICVGKFDLFNKWTLHAAKSDKELTKVLRTIYLKPNWVCTTCKEFKVCCSIHLSFEELDRLWHEIYLTKGEMFSEPTSYSTGGPHG